MFRNVAAAALRHFARQRVLAIVSIGGLALSLAAALLIALQVRASFDYDRWIPEHDSIHRVALGLALGNTQDAPSAGAAAPVAAWIAQDYPQVRAVGRLRAQVLTVQSPDERLDETVHWTDASLFDVLRLPVVAGDARAALSRPDGVVLTSDAARRYFGDAGAALGRELTVGDAAFRVGAVLRDLPARTHLAFAVLVSSASRLSILPPPDAPLRLNVAFDELSSVLTYVRFARPQDAAVVAATLQQTTLRHVPVPRGPDGAPLVPVPQLHLQPLRSIHFVPAGANAMRPAGNRAAEISLAVIGALIVAIGALNYVNLVTAHAARRAREIAVRRMAGANRPLIALQFIGESMMAVVIAAILALSAVELALPWLSPLLGPDVPLEGWLTLDLLAALAATALVIGIAGGIHPAVVMSAGRALHRASGSRLRGLIVTFQFAILTTLIAGAIVVQAQTRFAVAGSLRFDPRGLAVIATRCSPSFADAVRALDGVTGAACSDARFGVGGGWAGVRSDPRAARALSITNVSAGEGLLALHGLVPLAGRFETRENGVVVNETAVRALGYANAQAALGRPARLLEGLGDAPSIVGVAPDFALQGVRHEIQPTIFRDVSREYRWLVVRLRGELTPALRASIGSVWRSTGDGGALRLELLDDAIRRRHGDLLAQARTLWAFVAVAMLIAALGLAALAAHVAQWRTREIGVRKALGAHPWHIVRLLLAQFARPVMWANLLAWPAAAWIARHWLEGFVHRITLSPGIFVAASLLALFIALVTTGVQAAQVARLRPAQTLRHVD